jgi:hypothetical protein
VTAPLDSEPLIDSVIENERAFAEFVALRAYRSDLRKQVEGDSDRRKRLQIALVVSLILHGLLYLGVRQWTLLHRENAADTQVIQLRLIEPVADIPLPLDVPPPPPSVEPARDPTTPTTSQLPAIAPAPPMPVKPPSPPVSPLVSNAITPANPDANAATGIFDKEGRVILPAAAEDDPAVFGSRKHTPEFSPNPMAHPSPLPYKATPFDRYWKPDGETLLGEWVRKASKETVYDTKHGTRITCKAFLFMMACGWGPTPRVTIEELKAMRENPPLPRHSADDPYVQPVE